MKLTPKQRLFIYRKLLKAACEDPAVNKGMCHYLHFIGDGSSIMPKHWEWLGGCRKITYLKELYDVAGGSTCLNYFDYWAPLTEEGWETRIGWIEQAIVNVKKKIK